MKKRHRILSLLLVVFLLLTALAVPAAAAELPFTDVPADAWYRNAVEYAYENGLFKGNTPTEFAPNSPMTRAMFVQVLANKTGNYLKADWAGKSSFSDVGKNKWYAAPIEWASKAGLVSGTGNGKFSPEQNVTREQMAAIMYNYAKNTGNDTSFDADALSAFPDAATVSNYAREAMQWAVTHKIINGSNGKLIPKSSAKRCEVAQVAVNAEPVLVKNDVEVTPEIPADPEDPTPDDLPEGALTYQEFVDAFPKMEIRSGKTIGMYSDSPAVDLELVRALDTTGTSIIRKYAIAQLESLRNYYENFTKQDILVLSYGLDWNTRSSEITLWYYPDGANSHYLQMSSFSQYL